MKALLACLFLIVMLIISNDGKIDDNNKIRHKRFDGLVRDLLNQMVAERLERTKLLEEFQKIKTHVGDVGRELKVRNTLLQDTKFLQRKLLRDVKDMKEEVLEASKISIEKSLTKVNKRVIKLEKLGKIISNEILDANNRVNGVSKVVNDTKTSLSRVKYKCNFIENMVEILKNKSENHSKQIAFSTKLSKVLTTSSALVFKRIITNIGGGYNVSDGIFYCPKDGLYMFSVTLEGYARVNVYGYLMKNSDNLSYMHENGKTTGYQAVSVSIAVKLVLGDKIWVKGTGIAYNYYSSVFTGVYIR